MWVSWYQNVSILHFIEAKDNGGGGDNCSYKMHKSPTNQHPGRMSLPVVQPQYQSISYYLINHENKARCIDNFLSYFVDTRIDQQ